MWKNTDIHFDSHSLQFTGLHIQKAYTSLGTSSMLILLLSAHLHVCILPDNCNYPGRPGVATLLPLNYHWSTLLHTEVVRSVAPLLHFFMLILHFVSGFLEISSDRLKKYDALLCYGVKNDPRNHYQG